VIDVTPRGLFVIEMIPGMMLEKLQTLTEPQLHRAWCRQRPPRPVPRRKSSNLA
jgi:acyl CoA:acetate/3-ketoacid CoA transferase beta subunit